MINNTTLVGRVTKVPELKFTTGNNIAVTSFNLAVERNYKNAQGERETDFINVVAWRGLAETMASFLAKGSLIGITGSIQTRNYQDKDGKTVHVTEVVADNFQMLEPKNVTDKRRNEQGQGQNYQNQGQQGGYQGQQNNYQGQNNNYQGQGNNYQNQQNQSTNNYGSFNYDNDPFENSNNVTDINDDDLPF